MSYPSSEKLFLFITLWGIPGLSNFFWNLVIQHIFLLLTFLAPYYLLSKNYFSLKNLKYGFLIFFGLNILLLILVELSFRLM